MHTDRFLFEIGCEDLPPWSGDHFQSRFLPLFLDELKQRKIGAREIMFFFTPRRFILLVKDVPVQTPDEEKEIIGPRYENAFDPSGVPTSAATGFARAHGVSVSELKVRETCGKKFVYVSKLVPSISSVKIFSEIIPSILRKIDIPRGMRWNQFNDLFYRPVRWILALFGDKVVPLEFGGVSSSRYTFGHRMLSSGRIKIHNWRDYFDKIEKAFVIPDEKIRQAFIVELVKRSLRNNEKFDQSVAENLANLVEYPCLIRCRFPDVKYNLPEDVLKVLIEKAKGIPIFCDKRIQREFFVVSDGNSNDSIIANYENLLRTRILDAQFFYDTDLSMPFHQFKEKLRRIVFHQRWGSIADRVDRLGKIAAIFSDIFGLCNEERNILMKIAELGKYDMASEMVKEFPDLQGTIGAMYASYAGEPDEVCRAIAEHVLPRFPGDFLPESSFGVLLGIIDRIDYLCCFISAGVDVSGSEDPYGLRRISTGLFHLIYKTGYDCNYTDIIDKILVVYGFSLSELEDVKKKMKDFFLQRFEASLEIDGFSKGLRLSVLKVEQMNFLRMRNKLETLRNFIRETSNADTILIPVTRVANILKQAREKKINIGEFRKEKLQEKGETELALTAQIYLKKLETLLEEKNFKEFLCVLGELKQPIDRFFDRVLVMCPEEDLRNNRLALLKMFNEVFLKFADFSFIREEDLKNAGKN